VAIRNQTKVSTLAIVPGMALDLNPFSTRLGAGRVLRNWIPERGRLARTTFAPQFTVKSDVAGGDVWHIRNFRYTRAGAPENRLLVIREDGKLYQRQSSYEQELFPAVSFTVSGPNGDAAPSDLGGAFVWTNPTNAATSNDTRAVQSVVRTGAEGTDYESNILLFDNLGFAIPAANTILGVIVLAEGRKSAGATVGILKVQLYTAALAGSAQYTSFTSTTDSVKTLGSTTDLWSAGLSPSAVNATDFAAAVKNFAGAGDAGTFASEIDTLTVTVIHASGLADKLIKKPFAQQLSNRFFFSDSVYKKVYDGRNVQNWGFSRTTTAPTVTAQNLAGSIVAATGVKGCITWVVLDEASNRVHESSRTNVSGFVVVGGVDDSVRLDITALTPPTRATHWSAYVSELDGTDVLRRAATTAITTLTVDVTAFPASTSPKAPIRNDPPPDSSVGWIAKNRIFLRDDDSTATFYFSALGEVKGLLNGAADESFCGFRTDSISDISNSDFVPDREIKCGIEHDNFVFIWSERYGYALIGEFNLLDNRSPRGIRKERVFSESCAGADSAASTPYGLAWMNPGRKVLLWTGGGTLTPISEPIQTSLDTIPNTEIGNVYLGWWSGNGRQWLIVTCRCSSKDDDADSALANRTFVYDFSRPSQRPDGEVDPGTWFEWTDLSATCVGHYYDEQGSPFLLLGTTNSDVRLVDAICNPAHLNYTATLGKTYLGATVQNNPRAVLRTGLMLPSGDSWTTANYVQLLTGDQVGPGAPALGSLTEPTIASAIDIENPDVLGTGIALTLDTALTSGDKRAWLVPQAAGAGNNVNVGGAFGKQFVFQFSYPAGNDSTGEADGRLSTRQNTIYKAALAFKPDKEMAR